MARHAAAGDQVHVIVVTRGHADLFPPESVDRVRAELREAHAILGSTTSRYFEFPAPRSGYGAAAHSGRRNRQSD